MFNFVVELKIKTMNQREISIQSFREKLDNNHAWPTLYMFKFIVPVGKEEEIEQLFPKNEVKTKQSSQGNYISVTAKLMMNSSEDVIDIYKKANEVQGVIAL